MFKTLYEAIIGAQVRAVTQETVVVKHRDGGYDTWYWKNYRRAFLSGEKLPARVAIVSPNGDVYHLNASDRRNHPSYRLDNS